MRILLVDDHAIFLDGLERIISSTPHNVVGRATSLADARKLLSSQPADLLIADYSIGRDSGLDLVRYARTQFPELKILVLTMHDEVHLVRAMLKAGVNGYLLKRDSHLELTDALEDIEAGKTVLSDPINKMLISRLEQEEAQAILTRREKEILQLVAKGHSSKEVADLLFISVRTVETHRRNIFQKTDTNNVAGLLQYAYSNGLVDPS